MQNSVLFGILITLLNKKKVTRQYLAEKYEISSRSVSRYLDTLTATGLPIYVTYGRHGGYSISDDYVIDKTFFTKEELQHVITALNATSNINTSVSSKVMDKITNLANAQTESSYVIQNETLVIDAGSWTNPDLFKTRMEIINKAIYGSKTIEITYSDRHDSKSKRQLDPYAMALKEGVWYVYAWCHTREDFRLFKLNRIKSIITTENSFERKESDVYGALKGHFEPDTAINVEFEFSSLIYDEIVQWLGEDSICERGVQYVASAELYDGKNLREKLLSYGSSIRVTSPISLRKELLDEAQRVLRQAIRNGDCKKEDVKL